MIVSSWLALNDYSSRFKVSASTLRRRIRCNELKYKFENGKYWIEAVAPKGFAGQNAAEVKSNGTLTTGLNTSSNTGLNTESSPEANGAFIQSAQELISELKKAYVLVLQEKEEQIMQLKEEVVDLKTFVKILEYEVERKKNEVVMTSLEL